MHLVLPFAGVGEVNHAWPVRGSLGRHLPKAPLSDEEIYAMRRAAWRKQGIVVIQLADVEDNWTRQAATNLANRLYGHRETT